METRDDRSQIFDFLYEFNAPVDPLLEVLVVGTESRKVTNDAAWPIKDRFIYAVYQLSAAQVSWLKRFSGFIFCADQSSMSFARREQKESLNTSKATVVTVAEPIRSLLKRAQSFKFAN